MAFTPGKTVTANAVDALRDYILEHNLQPGDSLPTESEFAELMGVSRGIIREALQYFRTLGIIESRPRKGMTLKSFLPDNPFAPYLPFCRHEEDRKAIREMRAIVDIGIIPMVIKRISPKELQELNSISCAMADADLPEIKKLDYEFHHLLLNIVNNKFLNCLQPFMLDYFTTAGNRDSEIYYQNPEKCRQHEKERHLAIVKALADGDEETAGRLMKYHFPN
ncbi:MAG: FCD domain-containing protein [Victivallales bacterium]|nr:FCD domain-containing protein [Victivallales bacterium]